MMKRFLPLLFVVAACGSGEKTPFCKCMDAGNELNEFSVTILDKDQIDKATQEKMNALNSKKKELCKEYEVMGGPEMLELKRACTDMEDIEELSHLTK